MQLRSYFNSKLHERFGGPANGEAGKEGGAIRLVEKENWQAPEALRF